MKNKESKNNQADVSKGISRGALIGIFIVVFTMIMTMSYPMIVEQETKEGKQWRIIWEGSLAQAAEADPGLNTSGFLQIFFVNHSATPNATFNQNDSSVLESWCDTNMPGATPNAWANADNFDIESFASELTFVIMVRTRYNKTHAWDTDKFIDTDCDTQITVTCTDWAVGGNIANVSGTKAITYNNTGEDYIWINWVWDNSGTGYQIADDAILTVSEVYIEARSNTI